MWAVMTIAAIGLNLTLGYAGQVSLAQGAFVGIGAYCGRAADASGLALSGWRLPGAGLLCFAIGWLLGYPALRVQHHYLAFVTLAFTTLVFLVLRNEEWLTGGIYGISGIPRPTIVRLVDQGARRFLFLLPRRCWRSSRRATWWHDALAVGTRLHRAARKPAARAVARHRYAALHADGLRHRLGARRHRGRAVCAAGAVHRADCVRARPVAQPAADGDRRRRGLFLRARSSAR